MCIGGAEREGDKPTNKLDRTYKSPQHRMRRNENFKSARGCRVYIVSMYSINIYTSDLCVCVCVFCGSVATVLWFLKTFVRYPCPVLCPRARVCCVWKTNGPKTPETGKKKGQDAHADNSILYPYTLAFTTHTHPHTSSIYSISGSRI